MNGKKNKFSHLTRIFNINEDWLTPVEYLPYIDALLGDIDLDPCSTHYANSQYLRARQIYTTKEDGLNIDAPWTGVTYLFPPTYGRCSFSKVRGTWRWGLRGGTNSHMPSVAWFKRLEREWKLRNIPEALFFSTSHEMFRAYTTMWDYPVCIPHKRCNLIRGNSEHRLETPFTWGFFIYLPRLDLGFNQSDNFQEIFSHLGKIIC